jgi:MOSC domain-containing protein YiiM
VARVLSVNVGRPQQVAVRRGRAVMSSIGKAPVSGRVRIAGVNVDGDDQADRRVHGGPDKAVYGYAHEDALWWSAKLGRELPSGMFGENLTLQGVEVTHAVIGERWRIGTVELEVCQPRFPCVKLGYRFGDPQMVKRFGLANRPGAYLRIIAEGELGAGDEVDITRRPSHGVTIAQVSRAILLEDGNPDELAAAAIAPELPASLSRWMLERAA